MTTTDMMTLRGVRSNAHSYRDMTHRGGGTGRCRSMRRQRPACSLQ